MTGDQQINAVHEPPAPYQDGRDGEELLNKCCADLCVSEARAMEIIEWAEENMAIKNEKIKMQNGGTARLMANLIRILEYCFRHPRLLPIFGVLYSFNLPLLDDIIGHDTPTGFAGKLGVAREAVNKEVLAARKHFGLPARRGQRDEAARLNMSRARLNQLKNGEPRND